MRISIYILSIFLLIPYTYGNDNLRFHHITLEDGLSNSHIYCIQQDEKGFIWIGTQDGLNRYDGYNFIHYYNKPNDSTSINDNTVFSLLVDGDTSIWVGTFTGLNHFNPKKGTFEQITFGMLGRHPAVIAINYIIKDDDGILWLGTSGYGLFKYNPSTKEYKQYSYSALNEIRITGNVNALWQTKDKKIWLGTNDKGIYIFDPETETFEQLINPSNPSSLKGTEYILKIYEDSHGLIWIGTRDDGLYCYEDNNFTHYTYNADNKSSLGGVEVYSILEDSYGNLWFGVNDGGLNLFNQQTKQFKRFVHTENKYGLLNNKIRYIFEDNQNNLWILSYQKGFNILHPHYSMFKYYNVAENILYKYESTTVLSIAMDDNKNLWVGTDGGGLKYIDRKKNTIKTYIPGELNQKTNYLTDKVIMSLYIDDDHKIWMGTYIGGLVIYDPLTDKWKSYQNNPDDPKSISHNYVTDILKDSKGNMWIATNGGGLNLFDKKTGTFTCFNATRNEYNMSIVNNWINCLMEDRRGRIWIGTYLGLSILDPENHLVKSFQRRKANETELSNNSIYCIHEDKEGRIWIGTQNGLNLFDEANETFTSYYVEDGLPNNVINGIIEDSQDNLWISTNKGISRFNVREMTFKNYTLSDGLQSNEFFRGSYYKGKNGELFFGGINGLNSFFPTDFKQSENYPLAVITDFKIFNEPVHIGQKINGRVILNQSISYTDKIELSYNQNSFSFEFSALNYTLPEKIQYRYIMEGFDPDWKIVNSSYRYVTYTNLDPGEYNFLVKASNIDNQWGDNYMKLKVVINPPWWLTWQAKVLYVLIFILFISGIILNIKAKMTRKHKEQHEKLLREQAIEINQAKLRFFTNISHEFRTPLTLILSPLEKMIKDKEIETKVKAKLEMVIKNARRLLRLVNQLLDLRKIDGEKMKLKVIYGNIIDYLKEILYSFEEYSVQKRIDLIFDNPFKEINTWFDPDKVDKIFFNLLSNAFKSTPERGQISMRLSQVLLSDNNTAEINYIQVEIIDTGKGIAKSELDRIFDRFYQVSENDDMVQQGTGLGLTLTKNFVEMHHGKIYVESIVGAGTSFKILLPVDDAIYDGEERIVKEDPMKNKYIHTVPVVDGQPAKSMDEDHKTHESTIIIVEDNFDLRNYLADEFGHDYNIIAVTNGKEAREAVFENMPDLVLSDIMMPEEDGLQLTDFLKKNIVTNHIPIILLTAKTENEQQIEGLKHGADAYITKPFDINYLKAQVEQLIENRKIIKEKYSKYFNNPDDIGSYPSVNDKFVEKVTNYIMKNLHEPTLNVEGMSSELGMSRGHLHRKIKSVIGMGPNEYIRMIRLKEAAKLLLKNDYNISEISYMVGFNNPAYFTKCFKDYFNVSPSDYISKNTFNRN
ncbi:MAG: response regulator [Bacteroidales bacterium]|nr:response regulator [Bacteroidales bacterium]